MPGLSHTIYSQIGDNFVAAALEVVKVGGIYKLPSPFDKSFLTNVFDDAEAVADCLGAITIAQQTEKKEKVKYLFGQASMWKNILILCFILLFKTDSAVLFICFSTKT